MPPSREVTVKLNIQAGNTGSVGQAFGGVAGGAAGGAAGFTGGIGAVGSALAAATASLVALGAAAVHFAGIASPGTVSQFDRAWADLQGVIGRSMIPIVEGLTMAFRLFGDFLATFLPSTNDVREALSPLQDIFASLRTEFEFLAEILKGSVYVGLQLVKIGLLALDAAIKASPLYWIAQAAKSAGMTGSLSSSVGAAAQPARFSGLQEYAKSAYLSAYSMGANIDPAKETAENTKDMVDLLRLIAEKEGVTADTQRRIR